MSLPMKQKRGTAAAITAAAPTPLAGELVFETDTLRFKLGDGATAWASLSYVVPYVTATDRILGRSSSGGGPAEEITCTAAGRALLDDADAAAQLATLGAAPTESPTFTGTALIAYANTPATPGLAFSGDPDTGIYSGSAGVIRFACGGSRRFAISTTSMNYSEAGSAAAPVFTINDDTDTGIFTSAANNWCVATGGNERLRLDASGNLRLGGANAGTSAAGAIHIKNGTAPTASITDGVILYSQDVSSSAELRVRDEAGNVTTLSPHSFPLIPGGPSEPMAWAYYSEREGHRINVDMLRLARLVERLTGEKLVYEEGP